MNLDNDSLQGEPSMAAAAAELELGCAILTPAAAPRLTSPTAGCRV